MSRGHQHIGSGTQNQGNSLGDRPCVRQSKMYREREGGHDMKNLLGNGNLNWNVNKLQGAYAGMAAKDAHAIPTKRTMSVDARQPPASPTTRDYNILHGAVSQQSNNEQVSRYPAPGPNAYPVKRADSRSRQMSVNTPSYNILTGATASTPKAVTEEVKRYPAPSPQSYQPILRSNQHTPAAAPQQQPYNILAGDVAPSREPIRNGRRQTQQVGGQGLSIFS